MSLLESEVTEIFLIANSENSSAEVSEKKILTESKVYYITPLQPSSSFFTFLYLYFVFC